MHLDEIADSLTKNNQGGYNEAFLSFSDVIDEMSGLLSVLSNQYRDRTGVIEKYKSEAQYNLLNWQKCSNEMIELYNKYQKLADEYKELKERMECKEKVWNTYRECLWLFGRKQRPGIFNKRDF